PEAQLDSFLLRVAVGYPDAEEEMEILARRQRRRDDTIAVAPVTSRAELLAMQAALEDVHVADVTARYVVALVRATRADHRVALAALRRRDFVLPDDVKAMTVPALAHRLVLKPELWASRVSAAHVVESLLAQVPAPGANAP